MFNVPKRSNGVLVNYSDFDRLDTLSYQARTTGLKGNELNFVLLKQGILMDGSELRHGMDRTHEFNPNHGVKAARVPVPHPTQELRDDLKQEMAYRNTNKPRPF
jgi:hypothetical protein